MAEYLLLLRGGPGQAGEEVSPAELQAYLEPYRAWLHELTMEGTLLSARRLDADGSKTVRWEGGGVTVMDGPYTESKDIVGGYYMLGVDTEAEALAIARRCPHLANGGSVELRPAFA